MPDTDIQIEKKKGHLYEGKQKGPQKGEKQEATGFRLLDGELFLYFVFRPSNTDTFVGLGITADFREMPLDLLYAILDQYVAICNGHRFFGYLFLIDYN